LLAPIEEQVDLTLWTDGYTVGWAQMVISVLIYLKNPSWFLYKKQYPLRLRVKEGLIPIIKHLKDRDC
jgi:hypothetical protein